MFYFCRHNDGKRSTYIIIIKNKEAGHKCIFFQVKKSRSLASSFTKMYIRHARFSEKLEAKYL